MCTSAVMDIENNGIKSVMEIKDLSTDILSHSILKIAGHRALSLAMRACPSFQAAAAPAIAMLAHESQIRIPKDEAPAATLERVHFRSTLLEQLAKDEGVLEDQKEGSFGYELGTSQAFLLSAIERNCHVLRLAPESMRSDAAVVRPVVARNGMALMHVSDELRNDKQTVLIAVRQNGNALGCASREMRQEREIVLEAVKQGGPKLEDELSGILTMGGPLHYASPELKRDFDVVSQALQTMRNRSIGVLSVEQREEIEATCLAEKRVGVVSIQSMHQEMARHWISTVDAMNTRGAEAGCMMIR